MDLIISAVISFVISLAVWKFIYHLKKSKEEEEEEEKNKIDNYTKAIDKLVDLLTNSQAFDLRMVLLHAYFPDCSIEDLYTRVSSEANYNDVLKEQLKHQLREVINNPALFLREKSGKAIQKKKKKNEVLIMKKNNSNKFDEILFLIMSICTIVLIIMAVVFTIIACVIILNPEWATHVAKILKIPVDYLGWFLL